MFLRTSSAVLLKRVQPLVPYCLNILDAGWFWTGLQNRESRLPSQLVPQTPTKVLVNFPLFGSFALFCVNRIVASLLSFLGLPWDQMGTLCSESSKLRSVPWEYYSLQANYGGPTENWVPEKSKPSCPANELGCAFHPQHLLLNSQWKLKRNGSSSERSSAFGSVLFKHSH